MMSLGPFSYAFAAVAFAVVLVLALSLWRERVRGSWLTAAFTMQILWAAAIAFAPPQPAHAVLLVGLVELLRNAAWFVVLVRCLARDAQRRRALLVLYGAIALVLLAWLASGALLARGVDLSGLVSVQVWGGLALAIAGLVLIEQLARNVRAGSAWHLKYLWLAIGGLFTYDLCLWSVSLLSGAPEATLWNARGFVNALVAAMLVFALPRMPAWNSAGFLSPQLVFFNATLIAAGLYVLAMAGASVLLRSFGGPWGAAVQTTFLAGAAMMLAVALLSEQARAWLRVTLAKHLLPSQYDYRTEWLRLTRTLSSTTDEPLHERSAKVMASFVSSANAGLWLRDPTGGYAPAGGELAPPAAPRESHGEFLEYLRRKEWICDLERVRSGAIDDDMPAVPDWLVHHPKAWLVVPLCCEDSLVGFVVIGQPLAPVPLGWEQLDLLRASARQIASYLAFEQAARRLAEMHQFEALNRMSAFLMHDLRHLIAQQALVVQNAAKHRHNPEFIDDAIVTIEHSVKRMTRLMEQLRKGLVAEPERRVELAELCGEVAERCSTREPRPRLGTVERPVESVAARERLVHVLEHVVRNAQDATPPEGAVTINLRRASQSAVIEVTDTGAGMSEEFLRSRLFRPFDTTKGEKGMGLGAYEVREFVRKCGGEVTVRSEPAKGTRFVISLPLAPTLSPGPAANDERPAA